jgi:hypothetical protein
LVLGNFWRTYKAPEEWVAWAKGSGKASSPGRWGGDIQDFYRWKGVAGLATIVSWLGPAAGRL